MISWIPDSADVTARPVSWIDGTGCDALVLHTSSDEPLTVAAQWNRDARSDPERYAVAVQRWMDYFEANGIDLISFGSVVVRRRAPTDGSTNWARAMRMPTRRLEPAGHQIERLFAAQDHLRSLPEGRSLLDERLRVCADGVLDQQLRLGADGWTMSESTLTIGSGMRFSAALDQLTAALVLGLDGTRTVREALRGAPGDRSDESLEEIGLRVARGMLEAGFLEISD
jgi:hypothetical protein